MSGRSAFRASVLASIGIAATACATSGAMHAPRSVDPRGARSAHPTSVVEQLPAGDLHDRVEAVAAAFREHGAHPVVERWLAFLPPEAWHAFTMRADRAMCVGFVAVGREALTDIDLELRNASAVRIARDNRANAHPYVRACIHAGDSLYVVVNAVHGAGETVVVPMIDAPIVPPDLDAVLGVRSSGAFAPPRTPRVAIGVDPIVPDVRQSLERRIERAARLGYRRRAETIETGRLEMSHPEAHPVPLEAGGCYLVLASGGTGVEDLRIQLNTPDHRPLARSSDQDDHPEFRTCVPTSGAYELQLEVATGAGDWAFAVLQMDPAIETPADVGGQERAGTLELAADGRRHGMSLVRAPVRSGALAGHPSSFPIDLVGGRCYLFGAAANEAIAGLDMALSDDHGAIIASDTATREMARIYHCAERAMRVRVEVRSAAGRGEFSFVALEGPPG